MFLMRWSRSVPSRFGSGQLCGDRRLWISGITLLPCAAARQAATQNQAMAHPQHQTVVANPA
jgi:hypothetical protein